MRVGSQSGLNVCIIGKLLTVRNKSEEKKKKEKKKNHRCPLKIFKIRKHKKIHSNENSCSTLDNS